jgi:site-specific DNA recombinase
MRIDPGSSRSAAPTNSPYGLAYFRVSTSGQANTSFDEDGFSIQAQREYCQRKATEMGVELVDEYVDRGKSARTAGRPALQAMLARIREDTDIQYVFVHKLDRLARSREDDVQIGLLLAKNGVQLVSCTENIDDTPSGKLVHGIMADIAEWYSANLSEEAKKGLRKKVEIGGTPHKAPLGYLNERLKIIELGKDIGTVKLHDTYGPIITECFKLYDTGLCSLSDVATYANDQGLRLPADKRLPERPITTQYMHRLLRKRYYTGWVTFGGVEYKGEHAPLIDEATFARVQALLTARNLNKDKNRKRPHHLKGALFCAACGRRLGICAPTKRKTGVSHAYFYCLGHQHNTNSCPQRYLPVSDIEDAVHAYWVHVHLPTERIRALRQVVIESFAGKHEQGQAEIEQQKRRIIAFEQRRKKAKAAYYGDVLDLEEFKAEQTTIKQGITAAEAAIAKWGIEIESITHALDDALQLVTDPKALYDTLPEGLKVLLVQTVFEKIWIMDTTVVGCELTEPFAELLTLEARLIEAEQRQTTTQPTMAHSTGAGTDEEATYHRRRMTVSQLFSSLGSSWGRPYVERPHGALAIDKQNPGVSRGRSSNMHTLVGVRRFKLNPELQRYLQDDQAA